MTWAHVVANGGGPFELRLVIAGYPREWITDGMTAGVVSSGVGTDRTRCHGLIREGLRKSERARLAEGFPDQGGCTATIIDIDEQATAEFTAVPSVRVWLTVTRETDDTLFTFTSNGGMVDDGYYHIGTETIKATSRPFTLEPGEGEGMIVVYSATQYNVERGKWNTIAQGHWVQRGESLIAPELTDVPVTMTGRRWMLYAHGPKEIGVNEQGTLIARGVVAAEPQERDGAWTLRLDPIASVLDQEIVQPLANALHLQGIYYPWTAPLHLTFVESTASDSTSGTAGSNYSVVLSGYWADQQSFVDDLNTALTAALGSLNGDFYAAIQDGRWELYYVPGAGSKWVYVMASNLVDGTVDPIKIVHVASQTVTSIVASGQTYRAIWNAYGTDYHRSLYPPPISRSDMEAPEAALRSVPRSNTYDFSVEGDYPLEMKTDAETADNPRSRLYVREAYLLNVGDSLTITTNNGEAAAPIVRTFEVSAIDATTGAVDLVGDEWIQAVWAGSSGPLLRAATDVVGEATDLAGFRDAMVSDGPLRGNLGDWPLVDGDDMADWSDAVTIAAESRAPLTQRIYTFPKRIGLRDVISQELRTYGLFLYTDASEKLAVRPITPALETDATSATIHSDYRVVDDGFGTIDAVADGVINVAEMKTGYNPESGSFDGDTFVFPNAVSISRNGGRKRTLEIHPRVAVAPGVTWTAEDAQAICTAPISFFGERYYVVTIPVTLALFDLRVGDGVDFNIPQLPWNGSRGIDTTGIVIGYSWDFEQGAGDLDVLVRDVANVAGYTPSARVSAAVNTSGNTWTISTEANRYGPSGTNDARLVAAGSRVRVVAFDATSGSVEGLVVSVGTSTMVVVFDGVWTPSTTTWEIVFTDHVDILAGPTAAAQERYCFIADDDRTLSDSSPARNFA
jgi:hypothetical protein